MHNLFTPLKLGAITLPNRILMAPLTRCRSGESHIPGALMAEYYAQRAGAGLIIAEATIAIEGNSAFWQEPGIYTEPQVAGWKTVTNAVHAAGGLIYLQIWHGGRACHPLLNNGTQPVAPSPIAITGLEARTPEGKKPYVTPRELSDDELPLVVKGFKQAAENARSAGFDGIEIHSANGYLLDEFLRDGSNHRSGPYGGSIENRARLLLEVLDAVCTVWGSDRVGVRLSPLNSVNKMQDSDPVALSTWLAINLNNLNLAYLHLIRGDLLGIQNLDILTPIRSHYQGTLIGNLGYSPEEAESAIIAGHVDAVAFGRAFISNPDLPMRIKTGNPLNEPNPNTFYTHGPVGYTDYPSLA